MNYDINHKNIERIFIQLLNGHHDLCKKIMNYKKDLELDDVRDSMVDRNFYNWLNHDITIRSQLIMKPYHQTYFLMNKNDLGLTQDDGEYGFRRNKSLTLCYQSKWWRSTMKNNYEWKMIHKMINLMPKMKIFKLETYMEPGWIFDFNDFNDMDYYALWKQPNIQQIKEIYNIIKNDLLTFEANMNYLSNNFIVSFGHL